jgi:hypothetical protein
MINVLWSIGFLVLTFGFIRGLQQNVKLLHRYIFDGADARAPYITLLLVFNFIMHIELYYFLFTGYISPLLIFITQIYSFAWATHLFRSRLSGYVTMNLSKNLKNNVYIIFTLIYWMVLFTLILNFDPSVIPNVQREFITVEQFDKFIILFQNNYFGFLDIPFFIFSFLVPGLLLWFDLNEKRSRHIKFDLLFFIPILTMSLNYFIDIKIILFIVDILYLLFPTFILEKEISSIMRHSNRIDVRVNQIKKILTDIVKICPQCPGHCVIRNENCKMNSKQKFQLKLIAKMIIEDPQLEDLVLVKHFFNQRKYNNIYDKLNMAIAHEKAVNIQS